MPRKRAKGLKGFDFVDPDVLTMEVVLGTQEKQDFDLLEVKQGSFDRMFIDDDLNHKGLRHCLLQELLVYAETLITEGFYMVLGSELVKDGKRFVPYIAFKNKRKSLNLYQLETDFGSDVFILTAKVTYE